MSKNPMSTAAVDNEKRSAWFDDLITTLRVHEVQLDTNTIDPKLKKLYDLMIDQNLDELYRMNKSSAQQFFVKKIILEYLRLLGDNTPKKLAFNFNDSEVLVWAEISDNDHKLESELNLAEAKINAIFHPYGFDMESMIVESGDGLSIPNHYKVFK